MNQRFDILCNNCGSQVVFRPYQEYTTCSSCGTYLKLEETERTVATVIVEKQEFLKTQQKPISVGQNDYYLRQQELNEYEGQLKELEENWEQQQETFKIKNNKKMILPRKAQSLFFTVIGIIVILGTIIVWNSSNTFLIIMGVAWITSSGREYYKAIKYEQAKEDYEDEKERLQMAVDLLK